MNNSIQYFLENGIPGLEKIKKDFLANPACFDEYIEEVKKKEEKSTEKMEEEKYFSATEMITWEKKHRKTNGKYIEALRASISSQISAKIFFNTSIAGLC